MPTKEQILEMIDRAEVVKVGVGGNGEAAYFNISHEEARCKADLIAGYGLMVEFGSLKELEHVLYIESQR